MELEEMKTLWDEMSDQVEKQQLLTNKLIIEMTQQKFKRRLNNISIPETIGAVICFVAAMGIAINLGKLDNWYLLLSGIFSIAFLVIIPILSLRSIHNMKSINFAKNNLKQTLINFANSKSRFLLIQRMSLYLSVGLMIVILPVAGKIMKDRDLFVEGNILIWYIIIMAGFLFFFARWGYRCYSNIANSAENALKELEQ